MNWKQSTVIRILLLVARMLADHSWEKEISHLSNHITTAREPFPEDIDARIASALLAARPSIVSEAVSNIHEVQRRAGTQ